MDAQDVKLVVEVGKKLGEAYYLIEDNTSEDVKPLKTVLTAIFIAFEKGDEEDLQLFYNKMVDFCSHMARKYEDN